MQKKMNMAETLLMLTSTVGDVGIYAKHVEGSFYFSINEDTPFPMASTCKIALVAYCLWLVEQKQLGLENVIHILPEEVRSGSGNLAIHFTIPGVSLSIHNLIRLALEESDNTAADILFKLCGGPEKVNEFLINHTIKGMRVDRTILQLFTDLAGIPRLPSDKCRLEEFIDLESKILLEDKEKSHMRFFSDRQDTCTPKAMIDLLCKLVSGNLLTQENYEFQFSNMQRCRTGLNRIRAGLPLGVIIGQKTGTLDRVVNDVGIIQLPEQRGHLILAIFIKKSTGTLSESEAVIAAISKIIFEKVMHLMSDVEKAPENRTL
jgi:beta-lactamase class A